MPAATAAEPTSAPVRQLFPGWTSRLVIAAALAIVLLMRLFLRLDDAPWPFNDPAVCNIVTVVFSFVAILTFWIWVCFLSGLPLLVRRLVLIGSLIVVGGFFLLFRLEEFTGSMIPRFVPRWLAAHDRRLGKVEAESAPQQIDLTTTTPEDFPQFLGPERSCWIAGPALARNWTAEPPKLLWKQPIGAGWSAFSAVNGYAVTMEQRGDDEWVTCYEIDTGKPVWGHAAQARHQDAMGGVGPRSTPTIYQGRIYALGATGVLRCLDGATGKLLWQDDLVTRYGLTQSQSEAMVQWGRAASPLVLDDLVVVPGGGPAGKAKNLVAFQAKSGELVWESENVKSGGEADQIAYASPALATLSGKRQILIVNESTASGHDPETGQRLWTYDWPGRSNANASTSQAVAIDGRYVLLSKGYTGGAELLEFAVEAAASSHPQSKWHNSRVLQTKLTNVVIFQEHIYGLSEGILECVEIATGKRKWKAGRYGHGQILGVGDLLLVLAEDGRLALVAASPQKFTELGSLQALEGKTWNNLCLYGKKLLIRNGQEAACYELP
jgi:outer membrane protein assembly factor BamB